MGERSDDNDKVRELTGLVEELRAELAEARERLEDAESARHAAEAAATSAGDGEPPVDAAELDGLRGELREIRSFQGSIVQGNLPLVLVAVDPELRVFVWNPAAEAFWGRAAADVLGQPLTEVDMRPDALLDAMVEQARQVMDDAKPRVSDPSTHVCDDDREMRVRIHAEPVTGESRDVLGAILSVEDLTRDMANARERELQDLFQDSLTSSLPMALVVTDSEGRVISWNPQASQILKVPEDDALGEDLFGLGTVLKETDFREMLQAAEDQRKPSRFMVRPDGPDSRATYIVTFAPLRARGGDIFGRVLLVERTVKKDGSTE